MSSSSGKTETTRTVYHSKFVQTVKITILESKLFKENDVQECTKSS